MGRSRGGLTTKIHAVVDGRGLPVRLGLTPGQAHDTALAADLLGDLASDTVVIADKAFDADGVRAMIESQDAAPNIPDRRNRRHRHCFSTTLYKARNRVERFFNRIKHLRRIATRFEKYAANYLAMLKLAAIRVWLRYFESVA